MDDFSLGCRFELGPGLAGQPGLFHRHHFHQQRPEFLQSRAAVQALQPPVRSVFCQPRFSSDVFAAAAHTDGHNSDAIRHAGQRARHRTAHTSIRKQIESHEHFPSDTALDYTAWGPGWGNTAYSIFPTFAEKIVSTYLPGRRKFLYGASATLNGDVIPAAQPTNAVIFINSTDYNPVSGNPAEQYVELRNTNSYAVDVSYWKLTGAVEFTMRAGTVIPAGESLYLAASINAFRARATGPRAGQNIFVQGPFARLFKRARQFGFDFAKRPGRARQSKQFCRKPLRLALHRRKHRRLARRRRNRIFGQHRQFRFSLTNSPPTACPLAASPFPTTPTTPCSSAARPLPKALTRSADGRLLVMAGYNIALTNAALLGSSLASASATAAPRALGVLDMAGNFAIAAVTTNQYGGDNMRAGATDGSGNYWGAGATSGTFYFGDGPTNAIQLDVPNTTVIQDLGGNLYFSTQKTTPGLWKIPGTPTVPATNAAIFLSAGSKANPYAFALSSNATTAYLADDTLKGSGGIQRWDFSGGGWAMTYAFASPTNVGARGLAVDFTGAAPVIYATTAEPIANRLVAITDTGAASTATTLAIAGVNQIFRGVALAPNATSSPRIFGMPSKIPTTS